jgi:hypothetical protein
VTLFESECGREKRNYLTKKSEEVPSWDAWLLNFVHEKVVQRKSGVGNSTKKQNQKTKKKVILLYVCRMVDQKEIQRPAQNNYCGTFIKRCLNEERRL